MARRISKPNLKPEANASVVACLSSLLGPELRAAHCERDLRKRLNAKGYTVKSGYLATLPHGKLICPLSVL
ncbi:MAG: hypothetical protein AAF841_03470 [Pseudomonadota bacterium]